MENAEWILCPTCQNKARIKILSDTIEAFFTYVGKIRIPINIENTEDVDIA